MRNLILISLIFLVSCAPKSRCKKPWWKLPNNKYYQQEQKQSGNKYKKHKKHNSKNNKCKKW